MEYASVYKQFPKINQANIERSLLTKTEIIHILENNRRKGLFSIIGNYSIV